mgnify:CR=1 FL=1
MYKMDKYGLKKSYMNSYNMDKTNGNKMIKIMIIICGLFK